MTTGNRLLDRLSVEQRGRVLAVAHRQSWAHGGTLYVQDQAVREVHFPISGAYSVILSTNQGEQVEALTIGSEGMVGAAAFLHAGASPFETVAQVGGTTLTLPVSALLGLAHDSTVFDELLRRYVVYEQRAVYQSAACNALHHVEERLARWLLQSHDRAGMERLPLTQEFLAAMLAIRRQSVSQVASELQRKGLIRYSRGMVEIVDRKGLEASSCECYDVVRQFYESIIA
jgi:CRP-like cAMP-binding protein